MTPTQQIALACGLICTLGRSVHAEAPAVSAEEYAAQIDRAYETRRLSEAWRLGQRAVAAYPDDPRLLHAYGFILEKVSFFREATEQLEKAWALAPENLEILLSLARAHWGAGNTDRARELAALARERWPHEQAVVELSDRIETELRILAGESLTHRPGGATQFVDHFCAKLAAGDVVDALLDDLAPALIDKLVRTRPENLNRREWVERFADSVIEEWHEQFTNNGNHYEGYQVDNDAEGRPDGSRVVWVNILVKRRWTKENVDRAQKRLADPALHHLMDHDMKSTLLALDPLDEQRYLTAQTSYATSSFAPVAVTVAKHDGGWRIVEIELNESSKLSELASTFAPPAGTGPVNKGDKPNFAYALGKAVLKLIGLLILLWLAVLVWRRVTG